MNFNVYVLVVCIFVFVALVGVFSFMITALVKMQMRAIRCGLEDEQLKAGREASKEKRGCTSIIFGSVLPAVVSILLATVFIFSTVVAITEDNKVGKMPVLKVVLSPSMSAVSEKNEHLIRDNVTDRIYTFDLVLLKELPAEEDLEIYDVVVYEVDKNLVLHRIVNIEEPNASHPDERYFVLQGDANDIQDRFPVRYSQMKSIYSGIRIPYIGSFIYFMRTFAGGLCLLLTVAVAFVLPYLQKFLKKIADERLAIIDPSPAEENNEEQEEQKE